MRIVNRKTFLSLHNGTLFHKYTPCNFDNILNVKGMSKFDQNDFVFADVPAVLCSGSSQYTDILLDAEDNGTSFELDFEDYMRDGLYDDEQLFVVYEKKDVEGMINKLQSCLKSYGEEI